MVRKVSARRNDPARLRSSQHREGPVIGDARNRKNRKFIQIYKADRGELFSHTFCWDLGTLRELKSRSKMLPKCSFQFTVWLGAAQTKNSLKVFDSSRRRRHCRRHFELSNTFGRFLVWAVPNQTVSVTKMSRFKLLEHLIWVQCRAHLIYTYMYIHV